MKRGGRPHSKAANRTHTKTTPLTRRKHLGPIGIAAVTQMTLQNQEPSKPWDYQVIAVNKASEGPASNVVTAVL